MANSAFNHSPSIVVPGASTNDAVVRWDGTGALTFQNSVFVVSDAGVISGVTQISIDNIRIYDNSIISTNSNGSINLTPDGTGSVVISKVDINAGDIAGVTISGGLTWSANQDLNNVNLTNVDIDSGDISAATISGGLTWSAAQDFNSQNLTNVDIDSGTIDGATIGASSASSVVATTIQLTSGSPSDGKVLTATDNSGNTAWETAGGGAISSTSGGAATYITRYSGTATLLGSANLQFATDDGSYLTIDAGAGTGDGADIYLRTAANSTGNPTLRWFEGTADGSIGNMRYQIGHEANGNKFSMYSRAIAGLSSSAGTGGNILEIPDGTGHFKFLDQISVGSADNNRFAFWTKNTQNVSTSLAYIITAADGVTSQGGLVFVSGRESSGSAKKFYDLLIHTYKDGNYEVLLGSGTVNGASTRTYDQNQSGLRLQMSSGTYDIAVWVLSAPNVE